MLLLKPTIQLNGKKYKIISQIGEGAFGYVYHAKSAITALGSSSKSEDFAIKKMICQTTEQSDEAKKEIEIMIKVKHINVLPLLDFSYTFNKQRQEEVLLLLPLYHTSVQQLIDQGPGYPYCAFHDGLDLVKVLRHCVDGLAAVHQAGFRHADLKPGNILLTTDNNAVLTDFGSCMPIPVTVTNRIEALEIQEKAASCTTASYRAPELYDTPSSIVIDGKSDIWSFGCLMYCLMYSKTPFESATEGLSTLSIQTGQFHYPAENIWPEDYVDLINKCLTLNPATRIDINEVQVSLKRLSGPPLDLKVPKQSEKVSNNHSEKETSPTNPNSISSSLKKLSFLSSNKQSTSTTTVSGKSPMEGIGSDSFVSHKGKDVASSSTTTSPKADQQTTTAVLQTPSPSKSIDFADFDSNIHNNEDALQSPSNPENKDFDPFNSSKDELVFDDILANKTPAKQPAATDEFNGDDDDEFGDFTGMNVRRSSVKNASTSSQSNSNPTSPTAKSNKTDQTTTTKSDKIENEEEILDLHHVLLNDIATKKILKEGTVFSMRMGGFPKRLTKKANWLILTPTGLLLRKDKQISSKIHEIITFHRPLSITPSDTLAVGMNGLIICGWKPLPLFSGDHHDDSDAEPAAEKSEPEPGKTSTPENHDHQTWYTLKYKKSPLDGSDATRKDFRTKAVSGINMEISFADRDEMNEWIDQIMIQYEQCVENILLQRL